MLLPWLTLCGHENKSCPRQIEFLSSDGKFRALPYRPPEALLAGLVVIFVCALGCKCSVDSNRTPDLAELPSASF